MKTTHPCYFVFAMVVSLSLTSGCAEEKQPGEREERRKPKAPVVREDSRTPDQKLMALAWSAGNLPEEEVRSRSRGLIQAGADPNAVPPGKTATPLTIAAGRGSLPLVQILVECGADVNRSIALIAAAQYGRYEIARYLLDRGADIDQKTSRGETALQCALRSRHRNEQLIQLLKERGRATLSLPAAAEAGDLAAIRRLVADGSDVNALSEEGLPPLTLAAQAGQVEACRLLLELGADPARKTRKGSTPLDYLLSTGKLEAVPVHGYELILSMCLRSGTGRETRSPRTTRSPDTA